MRRKREQIPDLYQDLSQSRDEFELTDSEFLSQKEESIHRLGMIESNSQVHKNLAKKIDAAIEK